ncbi:tetratricopeptide repeat protein [Flavilitoribacter nigricans]|uniref:Tetratricopeptide repeat protein n=1 Tax=Flavilitoribacter nigricans (strain ATCC 23147 / DSM 23189 / NBRC 102662 / NCIMB 1420 / SS-2) TaxID=1122177 RepID=A0A2D0N0M0_FLAN2|nr:tetratricopeptide repeat protein [Flavilitoribacter nigricans]PHN01980.1 hypothetical protein CRP01_34305 [Flavilitoribacter nigricans DSM 23189 = NBRC 102662]
MDKWLPNFSRYDIVDAEILRIINDTSPNEHIMRDYLEHTSNNLRGLIDHLVGISRPDTISSHRFQYKQNDNLKLDAFINLNKAGQCQIELSLATLFSLDDLFFRLCTNSDFFSTDFSTDNYSKKLWDGTQCMWLEKGGVLIPHTRYFDYRQQSRLDKVNRSNAYKSVYLSGFYHVVPFGDRARMQLAANMVYIGLLWILLHEEGHYWEGHLHYLQSKFGIKPEINETNQQYTFERDSAIHKVLEWQADRHAAWGVMDVLQQENVLPYPLPDYGQSYGWRLRLILVSLGATVLILQKIQQTYGSQQNYPNARTRIFTVLIQALNRLNKSKSPVWRNISQADRMSALVGSFNDLMVASEILVDPGDLIDLGDGFYDGRLNSRFKQLDFIDEPKEIIQIITSVLFEDQNSPYFSPDIKDKWSRETDEILRFHDQELHGMLKPFRVQTNTQSSDPGSEQPQEYSFFQFIKEQINQAEILIDKKEFTAAEKLLSEALKLSEQERSSPQIASCSNQLAILYLAMGEREKADIYLQKARAIRSAQQDKIQVALTEVNQAEIDRHNGSFATAISRNQNAIRTLLTMETIDARSGLANAYNNLGLCYAAAKEWQLAIEAYEHALSIKEEIQDWNGKAISYNNMYQPLQQLRRYEQIRHNCEQIEALIPKMEQDQHRLDWFIEIGTTYLNLFKDRIAAGRLLEKGAELMDQMGIWKHSSGISRQQVKLSALSCLYVREEEPSNFSQLLDVLYGNERPEEKRRLLERMQEQVDFTGLQQFTAVLANEMPGIEGKQNYLTISDHLHLLANVGIERALDLIPLNAKFQTGVDKIYEGDHRQAVTIFESLLEEGYETALCLMGLGSCRYFDRDYKRAVALLDEALKINPELAEAYYWKGVTLYGQDPELAASCLEKAINLRKSLEPEEIPEQEFVTERTHGAFARMKMEDRGMLLFPTVEETYYWKGSIALSLNENEAAIAALDYAIQLQPNRARYYTARGIAASSLGQYQQAQQDLYLATEQDTHNRDLYVWRAMVFIKADQPHLAFEDYHWAIQLKADAKIFLDRGQTLLGLGYYEDALADFQASQDFPSEDVDPLYWQGIAYALKNDYEEALSVLEQHIRSRGEDYNSVMWLGILHLALGQAEAALAHLQNSLRIKSYAPTHFWTAMAFQFMGKEQSAVEALRLMETQMAEEDPCMQSRLQAKLLLSRGADFEAFQYFELITQEQCGLIALQMEKWYFKVLCDLFPTSAIWPAAQEAFEQSMSRRMERYQRSKQ